MLEALDPDRLRKVYDEAAWRYDWQHALLTGGSDQRGRRRLVREAVRPGDNILDAGGGTGSTALLAARAAGPTGQVMLADVSTGMLEVARQRVHAAGLDNRISCLEGEIHHLPFANDSFDVVLSTYSLCPVVRPDQAALALYRLVKPGGRLGIAHSTDPENGWVKTLAQGVETLVTRWPALSLGCRSVDITEPLEAAGAVKRYETRMGVPLWPFQVLVFSKPAGADAQASDV